MTKDKIKADPKHQQASMGNNNKQQQKPPVKPHTYELIE